MLQALQLELYRNYLWKDFPHGLRVLLVDRDPHLLHSVKSRLEEWKYTVTTFERSKDAVAALENPENSFHVALVEATADMGLDRFSVLNAKNPIPTIMMSDTDNTNIMLEAIAMGAAEFLQKPLSDEKLKNIWQHVVRKAVSAGKMAIPQVVAIPSLVDSPSLNLDNDVSNDMVCIRKEKDEGFVIKGKPKLTVDVIGCEKFPAPSTPKQELAGIRSTDVRSEDNIDESSGNSERMQIHVTNEVEEMQQLIDSETVSSEESGSNSGQCTFTREVDSSTNDGALGFYMNCDKMEFDSSLHDFCMSMEGELLSDLDMDPEMLADFSVTDNEKLDMNIYSLDDCEILETELAEEEALLLAEVSKAEKKQMTVPNTPKSTINTSPVGISDMNFKQGESSYEKNLSKGDEAGKASSRNSQAKRKVKVDWTPDLHRRFVQAVEQLGVDKAVPSRILELMGVNCLNRHNIASHLQKYRSHRKHLLAREAEAATWNQKRQIYAAPGTRTTRELTPWLAHNGNPPIQPRPSIGYPPIPPAPQAPSFTSLHVWGHPTVDHSVAHMWQKQPMTPPTPWSAADGSFWQHPAPASAETWAHNAPAPGTPCIYPQPLVRFPIAPVPGVPHFIPSVFSGNHYKPEDSSILYNVNSEVPGHLKSSNLHPSKEAVDAAIGEVLANPWTPLPIGLKPPSLESVMTELQKQGIPTVPPASA